MARVMENTTSSAVMVLPSLNLTPLRSVKRICVGDNSCQRVANCGAGLKVALS